jgi:hypothetical protein
MGGTVPQMMLALLKTGLMSSRPGTMTSYPVFGPVVTVHPYPKKIKIILLYLELLSMRNAW